MTHSTAQVHTTPPPEDEIPLRRFCVFTDDGPVRFSLPARIETQRDREIAQGMIVYLLSPARLTALIVTISEMAKHEPEASVWVSDGDENDVAQCVDYLAAVETERD